MSVLENRHIAIVGAGVGGVAAGLLCARAGARVTLFESADEPRTVGSGILLQPNGLAVLYGLDLDERLQQRGARVTHLRVADAGGRTLLDVPVPRFAEGLDHALVVPRSELLSALVDLVVAEPRVECRFGTDVVDASADGSITYRTADGTATIAADLVVGADGVHSRVRKRGGIPARVGRSFWYVRGIGQPVETDATMTEYWTDLGIFGVAPLDHGTYFYAATHAEPVASALRERDVALFREVWTRALPIAGPVLAGLQRLEELVVSQVIRVDCARWTRGRIVLLGDAAHAMAPNLGQGANSALVDATVLAWELAQPGDQAAALLRYEKRRRPAVRVVQDVAGQLAWLSNKTHPAVRWLRDRATRHVASFMAGNVSMRLVEQSDPLWLRIAATNPGGAESP